MRFLFALFFAALVLTPQGTSADCSRAKVTLAESIPTDISIEPVEQITYDSWMRIIGRARQSIDIACFYMSLTDGSQYPPEDGGYMGQNVFNAFYTARANNVTIRIVQNKPSASMPDNDTQKLARDGIATVRTIDWPRVFGGGILHTKFIIVDGKHFYVGSANMDWRSLSQVKELGSVVEDCDELALDLGKVFDQYWTLANTGQLPPSWGPAYDTNYNMTRPFKFPALSRGPTAAYFAVSPPQLSAVPSRTDELDAILAAINSADKFVRFSVMDYAPTTLYNRPNSYWPPIDDALRTAAFQRNVTVQLMFSLWDHTKKSAYQWMYSLNSLYNIEVRLIHIPNKPIPFARVDHSKFIVTDKGVYITTSNCSGDYYTNTGGVSINFNNEDIRSEAWQIFDRDWTSEYCRPLSAPASTPMQPTPVQP